MANVTVKAQFMLSTGELISMSGTLAEGTEGELQTSTTYSTTATSLGQFANGKVLTSIVQPPTAPNGIAYAYIERRGAILCALPVAIDGVQGAACPMPFNFQLQAGDTLQVLANTASNRMFAYTVITNTGVHAIFSGTPSGAGNTDLTHILSSQSIGQSLTGQRVVAHYATSVDGAKLATGGVLCLNDRGLPVGGVSATVPQNLQPKAESIGGYVVNLNFVARVTTSS
tara:strand:+ start:3192 stop:3875 length:684 start_codon:yes stop_codon:yes gene_type:complete